jgi:hypothetical protein
MANKIKFKGFICNLEKYEYTNGRIALYLTDVKTGEDVIVPTVNVPEEYINDNEVIIKNYSENEGVLDVLINYKIISKPISFSKQGLPICKFLSN